MRGGIRRMRIWFECLNCFDMVCIAIALHGVLDHGERIPCA